MNNAASQPAAGGLNPREILMILFRNKWKIILFGLLGVAAAAGVYVKQEPPYKSTAKVYVKYLVKSGPMMTSEGGQTVTSVDSRGQNVFGTEFEIIRSWDLALKVAEAVGPGEILGPNLSTNPLPAAAAQVRGGIAIDQPRSSSVIAVSYLDPRPEMAVRVLQEIIDRYLESHRDTHLSLGSPDSLIRQTELERSRLNKLETELTTLKADLGIATTLDETRSHYQQLVGGIETSILDGKANLAQLEGQLTREEKDSLSNVDVSESIEVVARVDEGTIAKYQTLNIQLQHFLQEQLNLIGQFTPENPRMKQVLENIQTLESQKRGMEEEHPGLLMASSVKTPGSSTPQLIQDSSGVASQVIGTSLRLKLLNDELIRYNNKLAQLNLRESEVRELERERQIAEKNYLEFSSTLEITRFEKELDPSESSAIKVLQHPSFPYQDNGKRLKAAGGAFAVFLAMGIGLALARELVFDQSIRSPLEIESKLQLPLFMSIPRLADKNPVKLIGNGSGKSSESDGAMVKTGRMPWEVSHFIRPYCDALRDRLIMYFQLKNLHHKPKLVAVTSCSEGAGTTTLSAGLAASLSETGDGKVLLVDMNIDRPEMHPFFRGNLASSLSDLLQPGIESGHGENENLYLATASERNGKVTPLVPAKFYELLPKLKSSDFDYIIFDMPPIKQTSATVALSGLMDKVLLVVEPGKTNRDSVKRATDLMREQHADVAGVVNRMPKSAAKWLQPDLA